MAKQAKLNVTKQNNISSLPVHQMYVSSYEHLYVHMYVCV